MYRASDNTRKSNPRESSNLLSVLTFFYTIPTYVKGLKKDLVEKDIFRVLSRCKSQKLGNKLEKEWNRELKKPHPSILKSLGHVFGKEYAFYGTIHFILKTSLGIIQPKLIGKLVSYFDVNQTYMTPQDALICGTLVMLVALINALYYHGYMLMMDELGLRIRISLCSLIYRKSLRMSPASASKISSGRIFTSISKDAYSFDGAVTHTHDIWIACIQLPIVSYFMYQEVGWSGAASVLFLLILVPFQLLLAQKIQQTRLKSTAQTDERLKLIQEIITSIKIIKMYVWEKFFSEETNKRRTEEMKILRKAFYLRTVLIVIGILSSRLSFYIWVASYILLNHEITAEKAFVVLGFCNSLIAVIAVSIPYGIAEITEATTAAQRIAVVLLTKERVLERQSRNSIKTQVRIENADVVIGNKTVLENVNLFLSNNLIGVTGPVGCGKSALLQLILKDVDIAKGSVKRSGVISYATQEPWLFPGTIKQNILFGEPYNEVRYKTVLSVCALRPDLEIFAQRDETIVLDKGLNFSRGQQVRINLARAVYKSADIYLLDDSLTSLDAHVSRHVFTNCIKSFLKDKLVVFVTHTNQFLKESDRILELKKGSVENMVIPEEVDSTKRTIDGYEHLLTRNETNRRNQSIIEKKEFGENDALLKKNNDRNGIYHEDKKEGKVDYAIYKYYVESVGGWMKLIWILLVFIISQVFASGFDYFISQLVNKEQNLTTYKFENFTNTSEFKDIRSNTLGVYTILIILVTLLATAENFILFFYTTKASLKLHKAAFGNVMHATLAFFDLHMSGTILNRFSRDTAAIDDVLPYAIFPCIKSILVLGGVLSIVATASYYFIFITLAYVFLLYLLKALHMPIARSLKRLDNATRGPVVGHINASLDGLATIRARNAEELLIIQFDEHQDLHCSASYMYLTFARAFGFFLEILNAFFAATIIYMFILFFTNLQSGTVGLAITQVFALTTFLQWGLLMWTELENTMVSVERLADYSDIERDDKGLGETPISWPEAGRVTFNDVGFSYGKSPIPVLKNISFDVAPKEKIGIIGRTGAGKSSIISTLFRLYPIYGEISIDGVNIKRLNTSFLRNKLSIIPQDPTLFSGTLRANLDPYSEYSDAQIWNTLKEIHLEHAVEHLDMSVNEGGSNFSSGQRQLICLGRAILRNNKILILDEATANVDPETDVFIQRVIKRKFFNCTILTIAHRLNTILESDKVMVMDNGRIVEFDTPKNLLENEDSVFYGMAKRSGL